MTQFKTTILLIAALFITNSLAGLCKPGYVEVEDCLIKAVDPADGNCWWGYDARNCIEIYATSATQCADYCYSCLHCVYEYGCCADGNPTLYQTCYAQCISNI